VDWDELERFRKQAGHAQHKFLKALVATCGVHEAALSMALPPTTIRAWLADESLFLDSDYFAINCHSVVIEGTWYTALSPALFVDSGAFDNGITFDGTSKSWHTHLMNIIQNIPGRTWLTMAECVVSD
jgi:hypothetical protein